MCLIYSDHKYDLNTNVLVINSDLRARTRIPQLLKLPLVSLLFRLTQKECCY